MTDENGTDVLDMVTVSSTLPRSSRTRCTGPMASLIIRNYPDSVTLCASRSYQRVADGVGIQLLRNGGPTEGVTLALMLRLITGYPLIPVKLQTDGNST